ncbi:MAG TPA: LysR family transcriptional regulator [Burkholderiales bacterium]|nr:LysR family transcriptional regulator [Burkholderiales bacterium]
MIFHSVADHRSFSRAAEALYISQPAVSRAVRELEIQVDLPLVERGGGKGFRLTESGVALYEHARGIFALERAAMEDIQARVGSQNGRLVLGASTTIAGYRLPAYAAGFIGEHPSVSLEIRVGNTQEISRALVECEIDLALVEGAVEDARIHSAHWKDEALRVFTGKESGRLEDEVWLLREPGSGTREASEKMLQRYGIVPRRVIEIGSSEGIARTLASGLGVAMLPELVADELVNLGRIRPVDFHPVSRPLFLLLLKERPLLPLVKAFIEILGTDSAMLGHGREMRIAPG